MNKNDIIYAIKKFLKGNGFYLALGICLVAVLTLAITTAGGDIPEDIEYPSSVTELPSSEPPSSVTPPESDVEDVGKNESGVTPDSSEPESEPEPKPEPKPEPEPEPEPDKSFYLPTENTVTLGYSKDNLVFSDTLGEWRTHLATDFEGDIGDKIRAVSYGEVADIYNDELYGTTVIIDHGENLLSRYSGLRNVTVKTGETVEGKSVIGELSGDIPLEERDGVHLHFELIKNGEQIDINELLTK